MSRKTFDKWKILVEQQITSGLSVPKFCEQHQLSAKYFYARKAIIAKDNNRTGFIPVSYTHLTLPTSDLV